MCWIFRRSRRPRAAGRTCRPFRAPSNFGRSRFEYEGQGEPALSGIDLTIRAGEIIAFVGSSGSGKTTLVSLFPRFYDPTGGQILIDGVDLQTCSLRSVRGQIGIVSQEVVLFDDTVRNNIGYGRQGATPDDVMRAAQLAYAHEFIVRMPAGYDTLIGERGLKLSGGERQRSGDRAGDSPRPADPDSG